MPRVLLLRTQYTLYQTSNAKTLAPLTVKTILGWFFCAYHDLGIAFQAQK